MDVFEAHKYLDPTTFDDQSFLSFSSFADLTHSPLDEFSSFSVLGSSDKPSGKPYSAPTRHQTTHSLQSKGHSASQHIEAAIRSSSSSPPLYSHSDADSESPSDPFHVIPSSWTPLTPAVNDFGIFHSPSSPNAVSGPSRTSYPTTTPSHQHVSHRSSSSSDWNSPVTPSLTNKSSVDSLASFAPAPDFFLPPASSHSAFGWDDQSLGSSSSASKVPRSPPSPSPHRVASNPILGTHRHPRSVKQVTSMPALREEGQTLSETLCQEFDLDGMAASFGFTPMGNYIASPDHNQSNMFMRESPDDGANEMFLNLVADFDGFGTSDPSDPLSSQGTSPVGGSVDAQAQITPAESTSTTMVQPLETTVVLDSTLAGNAEGSKSGWQDDGSFDFSSVDFSGLIDFDQMIEPEVGGVRPSSVFTNVPVDTRPVTAPEPSGSLSVPHMGMLRSVSSDAVFPVKANTSLPTYTPQNYSYGSPMPDAMYGYASADPEVWGMTSSRPAELPSPPVMSRRNTSQPLSVHVPAASAYTIPSHGFYAAAPQSNPFPPGAGYTSQAPPKLPRGHGVGMKRVGSQPLPGSKAQMGMQVNYYQPSLRMPEHSEEERQRIRSEVQARKVSMSEASVMQPYVPPPPPPDHMFDAFAPSTSYHPLQQQQQMYPQPVPAQQRMGGWESPNLQAQPVQAYPQPRPQQHQPQSHPHPTSATGPVLTTAPLINVHPPAPGFYPSSTAPPHARTASAPVHRVHPPPHPGPSASSSRPMARMPSTPRARAASAATGSTPKQAKPRASPGRKRAVPSGGVDKWAGGNSDMFATTFVNYTPLDGQALLAGVAPSGSQSKRKREREETTGATSLIAPSMTASEGSGSGDESRSKRSKSSAASSPA